MIQKITISIFTICLDTRTKTKIIRNSLNRRDKTLNSKKNNYIIKLWKVTFYGKSSEPFKNDIQSNLNSAKFRIVVMSVNNKVCVMVENESPKFHI